MSQLRLTLLLPAGLLLILACSSTNPAPPQTDAAPVKMRVVRETVTVRDPELDKRVSLLELQLLEKEARVEELQSQLEVTRTAVARAMARAQRATSRAEAASGMAEAEVALQSLRSSAAQQSSETAQVTQLVRQSSAEFDKKNYGGALYLANEAKAFAASYRARVTGSGRQGSRPGETSFAPAIRVKVTSRGNIRDGPGTTFPVAFVVEGGTLLTGLSYTDDWIRVSDDGGRTGWIFRNLVGRP